MLCPNCGHDNPAQTSFCFQCATSLTQVKLKTRSRSQVILPPQPEVGVHRQSGQSSFKPLLWGIALILIVGLVITIFY